jgi:hypothetical protein
MEDVTGGKTPDRSHSGIRQFLFDTALIGQHHPERLVAVPGHHDVREPVCGAQHPACAVTQLISFEL